MSGQAALALLPITVETLRRLAGERLGGPFDGEGEGDHTLNPDMRDWVLERATRRAAVLIPIVPRQAGLSVILTRRPDSLRDHAGQVAFPGGKIDPGDASPEAAALREAREEIGLEPERAEVLGRLPDYLTGSGFRIAPVLALVDPAAPLRPDPAEVAAMFETPLEFLMDLANHRQSSRSFGGRERLFWEMPFGPHRIWGVTAGIIALMQRRLFR